MGDRYTLGPPRDSLGWPWPVPTWEGTGFRAFVDSPGPPGTMVAPESITDLLRVREWTISASYDGETSWSGSWTVLAGTRKTVGLDDPSGFGWGEAGDEWGAPGWQTVSEAIERRLTYESQGWLELAEVWIQDVIDPDGDRDVYLVSLVLMVPGWSFWRDLETPLSSPDPARPCWCPTIAGAAWAFRGSHGVGDAGLVGRARKVTWNDWELIDPGLTGYWVPDGWTLSVQPSAFFEE